MIAQVVRARTRGLPSSPMNSTWRSKRAPLGASPTQVRAGHRLAGADGAQIIDLVPGHDPDIGVDMLGRRDRVPVRGRHVLDPAHPGGIVDVAELVNVLGPRGDPLLERRHCSLGTPSGPSVKRTPARVKSEAITAFASGLPRSSRRAMSRLSVGSPESRSSAPSQSARVSTWSARLASISVPHPGDRNDRRDAASATRPKTAPQA